MKWFGRRSQAILFLMLWLGGCGGGRSWLPSWFPFFGKPEPPPPSKFERVWQVVESLAREQEWPLQRFEPQRGILQTDWMLLKDSFQQDTLSRTEADAYSICPPPTRGLFYRGKEIQVIIRVQLIENVRGRIPVKVESHFRTTVYLVGNPFPLGLVDCASTGEIEHALGQVIEHRLASQI